MISLLEALDAVGATSCVYVSAPSGEACGEVVRSQWPRNIVLCPNEPWFDVVADRVLVLVVADGWERSAQCCADVMLAVGRNIPVHDINGGLIGVSELCEGAGATISELCEVAGATVSEQVFDWLSRERSYQLAKFGTDNDDAHTSDGWDWWDQQLTNYWGRCRTLGLEIPGGRQALAKFVATAVGFLESAVRVYGPLPSPGVPSGDLDGGSVTEVAGHVDEPAAD